VTAPTPDPDRLAARAFIALQYLMPQHALTALVHAATRTRVPRVKDFLIERFVGGYHPDMSSSPIRSSTRASTPSSRARCARGHARRTPTRARSSRRSMAR
jgi:hypothetical protein